MGTTRGNFLDVERIRCLWPWDIVSNIKIKLHIDNLNMNPTQAFHHPKKSCEGKLDFVCCLKPLPKSIKEFYRNNRKPT